MKTTQVAALLSLSVGSLAFGQQAVQWKVVDGGNGHWYQKLGPYSSWQQASDDAVARGGHLMTFTSQSEWNFAFANIPSQPNGGTVLGGYQLPGSSEPGTWAWVTGETWPSFIDTTLFDDCPGGTGGSCSSTCDLPNQQDYLYFGWLGGTNPNQWFDDCGGSFNDDCGSVSRWSIVEWSADCNNDGIVDYGQILAGQLPDVNGNGVPDTCEPAPADCNANAIIDDREISSGRALDQNANLIPDECDSGAGLPRIRSMIVTRGEGAGPNFCGAWDTQDGEPFLWNMWVSRSGPSGPWVNRETEAVPFVLEMQLEPGENLLTLRHEPNGCGSSTQSVNLWLTDAATPSISALGGTTCAPFSGFLPTPGTSVPAAGTVSARVGLWNIAVESFTWTTGSDLVGQIALAPSGSPDLVGSVLIRVYQDCPCDVFRDFNVNGIDLGILLGQWGPSNQFTVTDFNGDGSVDGSDLGQLLAAWGPCPN